MGLLKLPRLLLIAGNGRNSGKTTLACHIIRKFSASHPIIAIKISPHKHKIAERGEVLFDSENLYIAEETETESGKDSSRMLGAGADRSFFVCASGDQLKAAFDKIVAFGDSHTMFVCESGGLRRYAEPGLFLIVSRPGDGKIRPGTQSLLRFRNTGLTFDGNRFNLNLDQIVIHQYRWKKLAGHDIV